MSSACTRPVPFASAQNTVLALDFHTPPELWTCFNQPPPFGQHAFCALDYSLVEETGDGGVKSSMLSIRICPTNSGACETSIIAPS